MLGVKTYEPDYIDRCRAAVKRHVTAYRALVKAAGDDRAAAKFEPLFFNDLVLVIDTQFAHRLRGVEGKDGNPVNEVTMLRDSLLQNEGLFTENSTIKYKPENSVLGLEYGDRIEISEKQFAKLGKAFYAEIEGRFT